MHADAIVIRHAASGAPHFVADRTNASIVNAGDGAHEHPTQALLDVLTMRAHGKTMEGLEVAIVGSVTSKRLDLRRNRVRRVRGERRHLVPDLQGGSRGRFGHGVMDKVFENAAFKLKGGEISPIIETSFGFHVIQRTD